MSLFDISIEPSVRRDGNCELHNAWIAVASANHVRIGREGGFMQVCHGKQSPLRRIKAGDRVAYYSPVSEFGRRDRLQAFTAIGTVVSTSPYQEEMGGGFRPFRHDVVWDDAQEAPIAPLLERLQFHQRAQNWGAKLRFGLLKVSAHDMREIAGAMRAVPRKTARSAD